MVESIFEEYKQSLIDIVDHAMIGFMMVLLNKPENFSYKTVDKLRKLFEKETSNLKIKIMELI